MANRKYKELKEKKDSTIKSMKEDLQKLDQISEESRRVSKIAGNASIIIKDLDKQFEEATKLDGKDVGFLFFATAIQCIRQYLLTYFPERKNDKESAKEPHKKEKEIFKKMFGEGQAPGDGGLYYATLGDIITKGVPYDVMFGSKDLGLGLSGRTHRFQTLGHDPLFGWVFGTANIMTNTLTKWNLHSYHVKPAPISNGNMRPKITDSAQTDLIFEKITERIQEEPLPLSLAAAVIKQRMHLKSDVFSTAGLPIPGLMALNPDTARKLAEHGIDVGNLMTVGKQVSYAAFINTLIAMIHGLFYEESARPRNLYDIRTRKILSYSNIIASSSNLIAVAMVETVGTCMKNKKLKDDALRYLDVGGMAVTVYRVVKDETFIKQVKQEFLEKEFYNLVMGVE